MVQTFDLPDLADGLISQPGGPPRSKKLSGFQRDMVAFADLPTKLKCWERFRCTSDARLRSKRVSKAEIVPFLSRHAFMLRAAFITSLVSCTAIVSFSPRCVAQAVNWKEVFPVRKHDFGTVAVAAKTEFSFPIKNTSDRSIHIRTVRASCGCTTPIIESKTIGPNETSNIRARFNTDTFKGKRGANLTVVIDRPVYTEVRLRVDGYIRSDMVFHPGSVEFETVDPDRPVTKTVKVLYAGRKNWKINKIESPRPWLVADFKEVKRRRGRVDYEVSITTAMGAPSGFFQDEVVVHINDSEMPRVPLRVSGEITSPLRISPGVIALGTLGPGESTSKKLVVLGQAPLVIESLTAEGWEIVVPLSNEAKKTHLLQAQFTPTSNAQGPRKSTLRITAAGDKGMSATALITAEVESGN